MIEMASTSSASRNFPTLRYLAAPFRWLFGSRRRILTAAAVLLGLIAAPVVWWSTQLLGLPDIGEPFDVQEFRSLTIPDDRNAFVLYRQAADRLKLLHASSKPEADKIDMKAPWSGAHPLVRRWVEENTEAMELYRKGTERPDALDPEQASDPDSYKMTQALQWFHSLALLEASRLEEQGDMVGAWTWYRAALRASHHASLRATAFRRMAAGRWQSAIRGRVTGWATDRRTTPALLRRALDDAVACGAFTSSEAYTLKATYSVEESALDQPHNPGRQLLVARLTAALDSRGYQLNSDQIRAVADAWRFWRREPERSRRVMRLVFANWLAYDEWPPDRRPGPDPNLPGPINLYAFGPGAPARARALSPEALDRWLKTTDDAQEVLRAWATFFRPLRVRERANHRSLVVSLADELYRRDRGSYPPSEEALVGPYLEELPDDGSGEAPAARGPSAQE
jgi:hypothetical protein